MDSYCDSRYLVFPASHHAAKAIMRNFDSPEQVLENYGTEVLHGCMKRQWSFAAGITDTFREMRL